MPEDVRYFRFLFSDKHLRNLLVEFGFGGLIEAFEKYVGEKNTRNLIRGFLVAGWGIIILVILTILEKFILIVQSIQVDPASSPWSIPSFFDVVFSREFSIAFTEEAGGPMLILICILLMVVWFRVIRLGYGQMKMLRKMDRRLQNLEQMACNPSGENSEQGENGSTSGPE